MKIYIAGKITGDPDYRAKFEEAETLLAEQGVVVLNPAVLPDGLDEEDYMRICFAMLDTADRVVLLPSWRDSRGATLERDYALRVGKPIMNL